MIVDEVVYVAAKRVDVIIFVDSVWVHLTSFGFSIVIPVEIP